MGNSESDLSKGAGSSEEESTRRWRENVEKMAAAATAVATVVAAGYAVAKLVSSSASEDDKTNDKGKMLVGSGSTSRGYQIPRNKLEGAGMGGNPKLKMNTDGSVRVNPAQAGYGGVIRDEKGHWKMGFYGRVFGDCSIEQAEIYGIYYGLKIMENEKLCGVEILSDSMPAMIHLIKNTRKESPIHHIIEDCKEMMQSMGCSLNYISRNENKVADKLADMGRNLETEELVRLSDPPNQVIKSLLDADARSASSYY